MGNHSLRATGITAHLKNGGRLEIAQQTANLRAAVPLASMIDEALRSPLRSSAWRLKTRYSIAWCVSYWFMDRTELSLNYNDPEPLMNTLARLFAQEGAATEVAVLANAKARMEQVDYDNWNGGTYTFDRIHHMNTSSGRMAW